ncbi:MAG: hypothetical protein HN352_11415 [Bacteroidetes bacterium]|nr:hypothetical protein [Bacteroidota bacterium]MBT3751621.1 hypothetical protein [Bacteroidota bacterium]MBT4411538.1 hypothetical protein [Bacteroidota bacterium]MBT7095692.1 hypothetical protein [Bacteroidota bacterium]MBT7464765.1 hypothetical protein [Bacteroidota bacterium]
MTTIRANLLYGVMWVLTLPPLLLLYPIARILSWLLHRIIKYRLDIIRNNLMKSFPEKSGEDLLAIESEYYKWLGRLLIESFKVVHWNPDRIARRIKIINPEILEHYANESQDIIILAGHTGNWEWSPGCICPLGFDVLGVYKPQSSKTFDRLVRRIRQKKQVHPIPMKATLRALSSKRNSSRPRALLLIADQTPAFGDINFWQDFLHQDTAWFTGAEKLAGRYGLPVLYLKMTQEKPGFYNCEYLPISEGEKDLESGQQTSFFIHALEHTIKNNPPYWLWSHRRWKHQR